MFLEIQAQHREAAQRIIQQQELPQEPPSPKGPKCGICLELMGQGTDRQMMAGVCGYVYFFSFSFYSFLCIALTSVFIYVQACVLQRLFWGSCENN